MDKTTRTHMDHLWSENRELQNDAYSYILKVTYHPVDWAYEAWDELLAIQQKYIDAGKTPWSIGGGDVWALDLVTDAGARHGAEQPAAAGRRNGGGRRRRWRRQKRRPGGRCRAATPKHRRGGHLLLLLSLLGIVVRRHRPCRLQLRQTRGRHDDEEHQEEGRGGRAQRRRSHGSARSAGSFPTDH